MGAVNFGGNLAGALLMVGKETFKDTPQLIQFLESPRNDDTGGTGQEMGFATTRLLKADRSTQEGDDLLL
jgi:hypothetical protein